MIDQGAENVHDISEFKSLGTYERRTIVERVLRATFTKLKLSLESLGLFPEVQASLLALGKINLRIRRN